MRCVQTSTSGRNVALLLAVLAMLLAGLAAGPAGAQQTADTSSEVPPQAPASIRTFKLSNDPKFAEKLEDIVGLYLDPPDHAVVLSVDEKRSHGERIATDALAE